MEIAYSMCQICKNGSSSKNIKMASATWWIYWTSFSSGVCLKEGEKFLLRR
jgi:hypothetical protein